MELYVRVLGVLRLALAVLAGLTGAVTLVVSSKLDASREALRNGQLGILVDPKNPGELRAGILEVLQREKGKVQSGLEYFSSDNFRARAHELIEKMLKTEKRKW